MPSKCTCIPVSLRFKGTNNNPGQTIGHMVDTCVGYLLRDLPTLLEVTEAGTIYSHES